MSSVHFKRTGDLPAFIDRFRSLPGPDTPGVAAAIVSADGVLATTVGSADIAAGLPVTENTGFRIASISKPMLAIALLRLQRRGVLSLSDELRKHIPEIPDFGTPILLEHLLRHRSGLHEKLELLTLGGADHSDHIGLPAVMALFSQQRALNFDVGAAYLYCNTGFTLLSEVLERATGRSFEENLRREVFDPLGMTRSRVVRRDDVIVPDMARGYVGPPHDRTYGHYGFPVRGEGGVVAPLVDLIAFVRALITNSLPDIRVAELSSGPGGTGFWYGKGFSCRHLDGRLLLGHAGHLPGFKSDIAVIPEEGIGTVWLSNDDGVDSFAANMALARLAIGLERVVCDPIPPPLRGRWIDGTDGALLDIAADGCGAALFGDPFPLVGHGPGRWLAEADVIDLSLENVGSELRITQGGRALGPLSRAFGADAVSTSDRICGRFRCPEADTIISIRRNASGVVVDTEGPYRRRRSEPAVHLGDDQLLWMPYRIPWTVWYTIRPATPARDVSEILISSARMRNLRAIRID